MKMSGGLIAYRYFSQLFFHALLHDNQLKTSLFDSTQPKDVFLRGKPENSTPAAVTKPHSFSC
jgi:hypothetical protein